MEAKQLAKIKERYTQQLCSARKRGINWLFTFESWWKMWQDSGQWLNRGRKSGQYCMARKGDEGPYSPDNVDIVLINVNCSDAKQKRSPRSGFSISEEHKQKIRIARAKQVITEETKEKLRQHNTGRPWSEARRKAHLASKV
jgi:hypothetical protein